MWGAHTAQAQLLAWSKPGNGCGRGHEADWDSLGTLRPLRPRATLSLWLCVEVWLPHSVSHTASLPIILCFGQDKRPETVEAGKLINRQAEELGTPGILGGVGCPKACSLVLSLTDFKWLARDHLAKPNRSRNVILAI